MCHSNMPLFLPSLNIPRMRHVSGVSIGAVKNHRVGWRARKRRSVAVASIITASGDELSPEVYQAAFETTARQVQQKRAAISATSNGCALDIKGE